MALDPEIWMGISRSHENDSTSSSITSLAVSHAIFTIPILVYLHCAPCNNYRATRIMSKMREIR